MRQLHKPKPIGLYFKNIRLGSLGMIRKALRECLPSWALLGLDFVGSSILEVVTDQNLKDRVVATMKLIGIAHIPKFDVFESALRSHQSKEKRADNTKRNLDAAIYRFQRNVGKAKNHWALSWYELQVEEAQRRLTGMAQVGSPDNHPTTSNTSSVAPSQQRDAQQEEEGWTVARKHHSAPNNTNTGEIKSGIAVEPNPGDSDAAANTEYVRQVIPGPADQGPGRTGEDEIMED